MRNKIVAIFISISFILGSFSVEIAAQTKSGEGTETNPYIIETTEELNSIREDITACYKLGSDIDLNNETWISISQFSGTLDGDGYVIRNLDTKGTGSFFANCQGTLKNIVLENVTATNGALVGNLTGTVDSCIAKGKISIQDGGGLVGYASGNAAVKNSGVQGNLTVQGGTYGGGLIGNTYGSTVSVENCFVTGNLSITSSESGGLIGRNNAMVSGCKVDAIGWVKGKEATGGLIGRNQGTIQKNTTNVYVESSRKVGGLIGINEGRVSLCAATGNVLSDTGYAGGLIVDHSQ